MVIFIFRYLFWFACAVAFPFPFDVDSASLAAHIASFHSVSRALIFSLYFWSSAFHSAGEKAAICSSKECTLCMTFQSERFLSRNPPFSNWRERNESKDHLGNGLGECLTQHKGTTVIVIVKETIVDGIIIASRSNVRTTCDVENLSPNFILIGCWGGLGLCYPCDVSYGHWKVARWQVNSSLCRPCGMPYLFGNETMCVATKLRTSYLYRMFQNMLLWRG